MQRPSLKRLTCVFAAFALALVSVATPAAADTPVSHSGTYGRHYLADSEEYPGVTCHYDGNQNLDRVRVTDPFVFAFSNDPDSLQVSWRFVVQARVGSGAWNAVRWSPMQFGEARTTRPADFSAMSVPVTANSAAIYRVVVKMVWYVGGKALNRVGGATHRSDWYRYVLAGANHGFCPGGIL
jgi:hypothetical protein